MFSKSSSIFKSDFFAIFTTFTCYRFFYYAYLYSCFRDDIVVKNTEQKYRQSIVKRKFLELYKKIGDV